MHFGEEDSAYREYRPATLDIGEDRVTDLLGEWQQLLAPAFSVKTDVPLPPVDIVKTETRHLACPQTEPNEQQDDGTITQTPLPITRSN